MERKTMKSNGKITPPRDAEGKEIPLDTDVLYFKDGSEHRVAKWVLYPYEGIRWAVVFDNEVRRDPDVLYLTQPDTWEKLEEDLDNLVVKNERLDKEISKLKGENAALKAQLDDWNGNAEGFQPDAYMKLPLDADGEPIRVGDEVNIDGDAMTVFGYRIHNDMLLLVAKDKKTSLFFTPEPSRVRHFKPEPADSWEKLLEDLDRAADAANRSLSASCCEWFSGSKGCAECPADESPDEVCGAQFVEDIAARIRKLRGEN